MRNGSVAHITHRGGGFAAGMIEGSMAVCCWHHGETEAGAGYDLLSQMQEPAAGAGREICPACKGDGICPGGTSCRDRCGAMDANHICPKCRGAGVLPATAYGSGAVTGVGLRGW